MMEKSLIGSKYSTIIFLPIVYFRKKSTTPFSLQILRISALILLVTGFYLPVLNFFSGSNPLHPEDNFLQWSFFKDFLSDSWNFRVIIFSLYQAFLSAVLSIIFSFPHHSSLAWRRDAVATRWHFISTSINTPIARYHHGPYFRRRARARGLRGCERDPRVRCATNIDVRCYNGAANGDRTVRVRARAKRHDAPAARGHQVLHRRPRDGTGRCLRVGGGERRRRGLRGGRRGLRRRSEGATTSASPHRPRCCSFS